MARRVYQETLFGDDTAARVAVGDAWTFEFHPDGYAPSRDYDGRFGRWSFLEISDPWDAKNTIRAYLAAEGEA